jgi:small subunit ribosomal protein S1
VLRAWRAGLPVEGKIEKVIKGGYEVRVGRLRGFCPHSQMDVHRVENPEEHVGKVYAFRILQLRRGGEDVVISRRALLEEERGDEQKAVRATLVEGSLTAGHVARTTDFGVFVDLGAGVTGLVHLTEISHARIGKPSDVVNPGDFVQVKILKVDEASGKISLSMKQAQDDPWAGVADVYHPGETVRATVRRHVDFGAFVEVRPGLEALVPSRELPPAPKSWREELAIGTEREFQVLAVDPSRRRLTLVPTDAAGAAVPDDRIVAGEHVTGRVQKVESFGVFIWLAPGKVGLMPKVWTGVPYGQPFETKFPVGSEIACEVVEIVDGGKRIRLAAAGIARRESEERRDRAPRGRDRDRDRDRGSHAVESHESQESQGTFGTNLGDALKAALQRNSE